MDLVIRRRDASLGWGSLLMSFGTAGYVIFLPQRLVIDSAAGTGRGLQAAAWHRSLPGGPRRSWGYHSLPGVLGVLGGHRSLPGVPGVLGERSPQSAPLHTPAWQETTALATQMLPWRKGSETPPRGPPAPQGWTMAPQG